MDIAKRTAVALTGLVFAGATALAMSAATPAAGTAQATPLLCNNGGGGGGGGGTIYNPYQPYQPHNMLFDHL